MEPHTLALPEGAEIQAVSAKGVTLHCPAPLKAGSVLEFDLLLGIRPLPVMARVFNSTRVSAVAHRVEAQFLAMQQGEKDILVDFLQAVGPAAVRARARRDE